MFARLDVFQAASDRLVGRETQLVNRSLFGSQPKDRPDFPAIQLGQELNRNFSTDMAAVEALGGVAPAGHWVETGGFNLFS